MDNGQERRKKTIEDSMTEQVHLIMQQHLNGSGRLFGGALMQWIDEVAGIVAMRHAETHRVVTAAVDNLQFKRAVYEGDILVLRGYVTYVGKTSMEGEIDTYTELPDGMRQTVNRAFFVMVAVDEDQKPVQVPDLVISRAKEIVEELSDEDITNRVSEIAAKEHTAKKKSKAKKYDEVDMAQMSLFDTVKDDDVLDELKNIDVGNLTPIDALNTIYRLQNKLKNRW